MDKKNITIYDIAREAGVSPATVSRILTGSTAVRQEKRTKVMQLIHKYNFQPNAHARALTENRSRLICMIVAHSGNSYYNSLFAACEAEAYARGYLSLLINTHSRPEYEASAFSRTREMRPEAVIVCGGRIDLDVPDPQFMNLLSRSKEQMRIVVGSRSPMPGIPGISVNHKASMDIAVRYLAGLGHREIGFIYTGTPYYGTRERMDQFHETMAALGLPVHPEWLIREIQSLRDKGIRRPTALLGMNDMVSVGILQGLLANGIRVPEDLSLLGFDDTYITNITTPQLSSVGYDYNDFGKKLIQTALSPEPPEELPADQLIPVFVTERQSCRPLSP